MNETRIFAKAYNTLFLHKSHTITLWFFFFFLYNTELNPQPLPKAHPIHTFLTLVKGKWKIETSNWHQNMHDEKLYIYSNGVKLSCEFFSWGTSEDYQYIPGIRGMFFHSYGRGRKTQYPLCIFAKVSANFPFPWALQMRPPAHTSCWRNIRAPDGQ